MQSLETRRDSLIYLLRLIPFKKTSSGAYNYKIETATSIPKKIKQFGHCQLNSHEVHQSGAASLKREKELHQQFKAFRQPCTEIILLKQIELRQVINEMVQTEGGGSSLKRILPRKWVSPN